MDQGVPGFAGGIARLWKLIDQHGDALEADLIDKGLRLRDCPTRGFNWRDLHIIVKHLDVDSNVYRALFPDSADWSLSNQLTAAILDVANWFVWVRQGHEGDPPDRIPRPGVINSPKARRKGTPMRMSEAKEVYAKVGPGGRVMSDEEKLERLSKIFRG